MLKLNYEVAEKIRTEYKKGGYTHNMLGQRYDVHPNTIWNILNFKTFTHGNRGSSELAEKVKHDYFNNKKISQREIAEKYGVSRNIVSAIITGRTQYKNV